MRGEGGGHTPQAVIVWFEFCFQLCLHCIVWSLFCFVRFEILFATKIDCNTNYMRPTSDATNFDCNNFRLQQKPITQEVHFLCSKNVFLIEKLLCCRVFSQSTYCRNKTVSYFPCSNMVRMGSKTHPRWFQDGSNMNSKMISGSPNPPPVKFSTLVGAVESDDLIYIYIYIYL